MELKMNLQTEPAKKIQTLYLDDVFMAEKLSALAAASKEAYQKAEPFPSGVFDDVFPTDFLDKVYDEFPMPEEMRQGTTYDDGHYEVSKYEVSQEKYFPPHIWALLRFLNSATYLNFLEEVTGIKGLIPDPGFYGAGIHQTVHGGKLGIHADFNKHPVTLLDRRVNSILYLNKDWKEEYNGHLELWDRKMKKCHARIAPLFNRIGMFSPTSDTWHGHPDPIAGPPGTTRKSLAVFYYTNGRPWNERKKRHNTLWRSRPGQAL
jgi:hypothetical protein